MHTGYFYLASPYQSWGKREICLLTKQSQIQILIKIPCLVQQNEVAIVGSEKFHKILLISKLNWQILSSAGAHGLWLGSCGGWNEGLDECVGKRHLRDGPWEARIRCGSCTKLLDLALGSNFMWLRDIRSPSFEVSWAKF